MENLKLNHFEPKTLIVPESTEEMIKALRVPSFTEFRVLGQEEQPTVPPQFTLRSNMSPVQNQSFGGFCTAFCTNSNLEYIHNKIHLSESCTNHEAESRWGDCIEGLATVYAYQACRDVGIVPIANWPYDASKVCWNPVPNTTGKPRYKFNSFANIYNRPSSAVVQNMIDIYNGKLLTISSSPGNFVRLLKEALVSWNVPASIDVPVWWQSDGHFKAGWENGPNIFMPSPALIRTWLDYHQISTEEKDLNEMTPPNVSGWHCISICGYDDSQARFIFKNSWGEWWGDNGGAGSTYPYGYGTIPYDYITAFSRSGFIGK